MLVTAADTSHAISVRQLIRTFREHHPDEIISVYDLGMTDEDKAEIIAMGYSRLYIDPFRYETKPDYFNVKVQAGQYAWKPAIIHEAAPLASRALIWADAGCRIDRPLTREIDWALQHGVYASSTTGTVAGYTHPDCLKYMGMDPAEAARYQMRAATLIVFDTMRQPVVQLITDWDYYASIEECIAPAGSSKKGGHRQDQSLFNVLLIQSGYYQHLPHEQARWGWTAHCDCDKRRRNV